MKNSAPAASGTQKASLRARRRRTVHTAAPSQSPVPTPAMIAHELPKSNATPSVSKPSDRYAASSCGPMSVAAAENADSTKARPMPSSSTLATRSPVRKRPEARTGFGVPQS